MFVIDDDNAEQFMPREGDKHFGLVQRDYDFHPYEKARAFGQQFGGPVPLIPREEWPERCAEMKANKTRLSDIRATMDNGRPAKSLNQNGEGFCWAYSPTVAAMLLRAVSGQPYVRLSAHGVACKIFGFQDRGAWAALAMDFIAKHGIPAVDDWPEQSMNRANDTDETWRNAQYMRFTEGWLDQDIQHASDADLTLDERASCLLSRFPVPTDYAGWWHSVCAMDLVDMKPNLGQQGLMDPSRFGQRIWNSWGDNWGDRGEAVIATTKYKVMGACCPRSILQ